MQSIVSGVDGYGSDRRQSGTEKVIQIIISHEVFFLPPTVCHITYPIVILHFGQTESLLKSQSGREMNISPPYGVSFFGRNKNNSVGCLTTIQGCGWSSFQDADTFHIFRIQIGDTVASVPVSGICRTANSRISLFRSGVRHRNSIYHIQRLIVSGYRAHPTNTDFRRPAHTGRVLADLHTGCLSCQSRDHIHFFHTIQFFSPHLLHGISQRGFFLFKSQSSYNHVVKQQNIFFQTYFKH